jgi:hypothetical protein
VNVVREELEVDLVALKETLHLLEGLNKTRKVGSWQRFQLYRLLCTSTGGCFPEGKTVNQLDSRGSIADMVKKFVFSPQRPDWL